jgi:hypothetical protein
MEFLSSLLPSFQNQEPFIIVIGIALGIEIVSRIIKRRLKRSIFRQYDGSTDPKHAEYYLEYYRKSQLVDMIRIISVLVCFGFLLIHTIDQAIIITFKDLWLSIAAFFFVVPQYSVGNIIRIGEAQGQIIFIRMFSVGILGKDNTGESTGQLFVIPNNKFLTEPIRKEELRSTSAMRDFFSIPYKNEWFPGSFADFMKELTTFLDDTFPVGNRKNVGNYQSYIGHRYKLDYEYEGDKCLSIKLSFIGRSDKNGENIAKIINFVESKKLKEERYGQNYLRNA